ncbi:MAG: hypothetical protein JSW25_08575 [Thermoplasmata archaeon]|nr:MAG: hypothetical protein JSW25_08575 [Thermoplasmata archaeon]
MRQPRGRTCGRGGCGLLLLVVVVATVLMLLAVPSADARHGLCVDGTFGPTRFSRAPVDTEPVDVTDHDEPDFQQRLFSYGGHLHVTWLTEEEDPEVTEYLFMRTLGPDGWGERVVVNNPVPEDGEFEGTHIRLAGYDVAEHDGLLWFVWSTPSVEQADGPDGDIVFRTFDGTAWGPITEITPAGDTAIDLTPAVASSGDRLVVAWSTGTETGRRISATWLDDDGWADPVAVTSPIDGGDDFNPRIEAVPGGSFIAWHHRETIPEGPTQVTVQARVLEGDALGPLVHVSGVGGYEDLWVDMIWHEDALMMVWQRAGLPLGFERSRIVLREWTPEGLGPERDITGGAHGGFNGRPAIGLTGEGPRVYWHTDDDGVSLGTSEDLVFRARDGRGLWGAVEVFQGDMGQDMVRVQLAEHRGQLWAAWMANVTFVEPPDFEPHQAWDVFVAPAHLGDDPHADKRVLVDWKLCEDAGERTVLTVEGPGGPMAGVHLEVVVLDPDGAKEAVLQGTTDEAGQVEFDHGYHQRGGYTILVAMDDDAIATLPVEVGSVPDHVVVDHDFAISTFLWVAAFAIVGYLFIRRRRGAI